mgnify:CR=1 FL=1
MTTLKSKGFTLVELVVVIGIVAILASIAYPSYTDYMANARRADAKNAILTLASYQERFHSDNGFYGSIMDLTGAATLMSDDGKYTMTIACTPNPACTAGSRSQQYLITATALVPDAKCGSYTYDQSGNIVLLGATENVAYCW